MLKKIIIVVAMLFVAVGLGLALTACDPMPPKPYCVNEPTIGPDGRAVNHIECTSPAYPGRG